MGLTQAPASEAAILRAYAFHRLGSEHVVARVVWPANFANSRPNSKSGAAIGPCACGFGSKSRAK